MVSLLWLSSSDLSYQPWFQCITWPFLFDFATRILGINTSTLLTFGHGRCVPNAVCWANTRGQSCQAVVLRPSGVKIFLFSPWMLCIKQKFNIHYALVSFQIIWHRYLKWVFVNIANVIWVLSHFLPLFCVMDMRNMTCIPCFQSSQESISNSGSTLALGKERLCVVESICHVWIFDEGTGIKSQECAGIHVLREYLVSSIIAPYDYISALAHQALTGHGVAAPSTIEQPTLLKPAASLWRNSLSNLSAYLALTARKHILRAERKCVVKWPKTALGPLCIVFSLNIKSLNESKIECFFIEEGRTPLCHSTSWGAENVMNEKLCLPALLFVCELRG